MLVLSPCCFAACGHHLSPRMAIVFSLLSSVPTYSMSSSSTSPIFSGNTSHSSLYNSHSPSNTTWYVSSTLYYFATRAHLCIYCLLLPATGIPWCQVPGISFFFLASPGRLHQIAVSAILRSPLGGANKLLFLSLRLTPRICLSSVSPISPCFLALAFPFFLSFLPLMPCTRQTSLRTSSLLAFLSCPSILSQLSYPTLFQLALRLLSPIQLHQL